MVGFWVSLAVLMAMSLAAWRPPRRSTWLSTPGYLAGWLINEAPLLALAALFATIALTASEGHFAPVGVETVASWAVAMAVAALLIVLLTRALTAHRVLHEAMIRELGIEVPRRRLGVRSLLPVPRRARGVRHIRNVRYGPFGRRNLLDLYVGSGRLVGVFVHFHGGHFRIGRKNSQSLPLLYHLAQSGWLCVSANYRLAPAARHPDWVVDAKRVIAWARDHAGDYGADPRCVVAAGDSAGGHLAMFAALTADQPRYQPGFEAMDTSVAAAISLYGYLGPTDGYPDSAPTAHAGAAAPPLLLVHGDRDSVVPVNWIREAAQRLHSAVDAPVVYVEMPGAQHGFDFLRSPRSDAVADAIVAFLDWVRVQEQIARSGTP